MMGPGHRSQDAQAWWRDGGTTHFACATLFYKTGVVFMAWLNGHQQHFAMVGGQQSARSVPHMCQLFRLADQANLMVDPDLALERMRHWLMVHGVTG